MNIIFVADYFLSELLGGGEICNDIIIKKLANKKHTITCIKSGDCNIQFLEKHADSVFFIANFALMPNSCMNYISKNLNYYIYEHDYKFVANRNPAVYKNFEVPQNQIVVPQFFKNARKIICQSEFQKNIIEKNLKFNNTVSLGTNFWNEEDYELMKKISLTPKNDLYAIIDYPIDHKNTNGAINYCVQNNISYNLIKDYNYHSFLLKLGSNKGFIFLPKTPETFSRTVLEAKMMNLELLTNNLIGCKYEDWFKKYNGIELIEYTKEKNELAIKIIEDMLCQ